MQRQAAVHHEQVVLLSVLLMDGTRTPFRQWVVVRDIPPVHAQPAGHLPHLFPDFDQVLKINRRPRVVERAGVTFFDRLFRSLEERTLFRELCRGRCLSAHRPDQQHRPVPDLLHGILDVGLQGQGIVQHQAGHPVHFRIELPQDPQPVGDIHQDLDPIPYPGRRFHHRLNRLEIPIPQSRLLETGREVRGKRPIFFEIMGVRNHDVGEFDRLVDL